MSTLRYAGGTYVVTAEDRLWLLRAVEAEGPPKLGVAQALVNGFAEARANRKRLGSLASYIRAYAQPVNPRWFTSGDLFAAQYNAAAPEEREVLFKRALLRQQVHAAATSFATETVDAVRDALTQGFASDVTDYAAPTIDATKKGMKARSVAVMGENRFWTKAPGWAGYVANGWASNGGSGVASLLLVFGAYLLMRARA